MPVFTIQAPDGRKIDIDATDQATAIQGAQAWATANPVAPAGGGPNAAMSADNRNPVRHWWDHVAQSAQQGFDQGVAAIQNRDPIQGAMTASNPAQGAMDALGPVLSGLTGAAGAAFAPLVNNGNNQEGVVSQADVNAVHHGQNAPLDSRYVTNAQRENTAGNIAVGLIPVDRLVQGAGALSAAAQRTRAAALAARAARAPTALQSRVAQFTQAGVDPTLGAVGGPQAANLTKFAAEDPIMGGAPQARLRSSIAQTGQSADQIAAGYGAAGSPAEAGQTLQRGVKRFAQGDGTAGSVDAPTNQQSFSAKAGALYDRAFGDLDTAMAGKTDPTTAIPAANAGAPHTIVGGNTVQAANEVASPAMTATGTSQIATPNTTAALQSAMTPGQSADINALITDPQIKGIASRLESGQGDLSFQDLRNLRTWVRTQRASPALTQTVDSATLGRLEGALTQDIYSNASNLGSPALLKQLQRADQYYASGQMRINDALSSTFDAPSAESAYNGLVASAQGGGRADISKLVSVKRSLRPDEWGDVVATTVKRLGSPNPGATGVAGADDAFSINNFVTNYNKLSPAGKAIMFGSKGGGGATATGLRAQLDNLAQVADMQKGIEAAANSSRSAIGVRGAGTIVGLANPATLGPTLAGLVGVRGLGEVMTNPNFVRWLARTSKAPTGALPGRLAALDALAKTDPAIAQVAPNLRLQLRGLQVAAPSALTSQEPANPSPAQ